MYDYDDVKMLKRPRQLLPYVKFRISKADTIPVSLTLPKDIKDSKRFKTMISIT